MSLKFLCPITLSLCYTTHGVNHHKHYPQHLPVSLSLFFSIFLLPLLSGKKAEKVSFWGKIVLYLHVFFQCLNEICGCPLNVDKCELVPAWVHVSNRMRGSESESRTSYKSLKNYNRIIAQLTFSFFSTRQRNTCPHPPLSFSFCEEMNFSFSPLILLHILREISMLDPSHNQDSLHTCTKITRFHSSDVICSRSVSLYLRWHYLWGWHGEGPVSGLEYRVWRGTIQGKRDQGG